MSYHKERRHAADVYQNMRREKVQVEEGDHVLLPVPRTDRSNTDPKTMEARVLKRVGNKVKLGTGAGRVDVTFRPEQLMKVTGRKRQFTVPDEDVSLITAMRFETTYNRTASSTSGPSLCNCKGTCLSKRCLCRKQGIDCATKCHGGKMSDACLNTRSCTR